MRNDVAFPEKSIAQEEMGDRDKKRQSEASRRSAGNTAESKSLEKEKWAGG
jgi:hypothetical protein